MKKVLVLIAAIAVMCSFNAAASNFNPEPEKCHFEDSEGKTHNGRMATTSGTWSNNSSDRSTSSSSGTVSAGVDLKVVKAGGDVNKGTSTESSNGRSSSQTITRESCCDNQNTCESVNYESGWKTKE